MKAWPTAHPAPPARRLYMNHFHEGVDYGISRPTGIHDWLLIYTVSGRGQFRQDQVQFDTQPHEVVLMGPHMPHGYRTSPQAGAWELLWAHFQPTPAWHAWMDWPVVGSGMYRLEILPGEARQQVLGHLTCAYETLRGFGFHRHALAVNAFEAALLWCDQNNPLRPAVHLDPRIQRAVDFAVRHLDKPLALSDLADACDLSVSRLSHLFAEQMGRTPMAFIQEQRLSRAQQLLENTSLSIGDIARRVGYDNPFYFTGRFTKTFGKSPRAYRQWINHNPPPPPPPEAPPEVAQEVAQAPEKLPGSSTQTPLE